MEHARYLHVLIYIDGERCIIVSVYIDNLRLESSSQTECNNSELSAPIL